MPVTPKHSLMQGEDDGIIFNEMGGSFLANARYLVYWMADLIGEAGKVEGYKVFTMSDGSQAIAKFEGDLSTGTWTFTGGTGKYQGVKGHETYNITYIEFTLYWDILEGEYELP